MSQPLCDRWPGRVAAFVRRSDGAAVIQHVIIMTVVLIVAGGGWMLGDGMNHVFGGFSGRLDGGYAAADATGWANAGTTPQYVTAQTLPRGGPWRWCIPAIGLVALGIAAWKIVYSRRGEQQLKATLDKSLESLHNLEQSRLFTKRQHLLRVLTNDKSLLLENRMQVRHLMTRDVVSVLPSAGLEEMVHAMEEHGLRHLLVRDKEGHLIGVVSDRDIAKMQGKTAKRLISPVPLTVSHDTPIGPAITYLIDKGISCLPVLEDGRLCGVLTTTDLIMALQCTLQLWVPVGQTMEQEQRWTDEELESLVGAACAKVQS